MTARPPVRLDQVDDVREAGVLADLGHLDIERATPVHGAGEDVGAGHRRPFAVATQAERDVGNELALTIGQLDLGHGVHSFNGWCLQPASSARPSHKSICMFG